MRGAPISRHVPTGRRAASPSHPHASVKRLGVLGALGTWASFASTVTIIPFMPDGWAASGGGFPAMTGNVPFLMKDVVLLAVSFYLLKQDAVRVPLTDRARAGWVAATARPSA